MLFKYKMRPKGITGHIGTAPYIQLFVSPSGMCAKLHTVAASNNRFHPTRSLSSSPLACTVNCSPGSQALLQVTHQDHSIGTTLRVHQSSHSIVHITRDYTPRSLYYCLFAPHIYVVVLRARSVRG